MQSVRGGFHFQVHLLLLSILFLYESILLSSRETCHGELIQNYSQTG